MNKEHEQPDILVVDDPEFEKDFYLKEKQKSHETESSESSKRPSKMQGNSNHSSREKKSNSQTNHGNKKGVMIGLAIATGILGATTLGFGIGYGIVQGQANDYGTKLENVYQKNFYELVDSVNNQEIKLSKVIESSERSYQKKLLKEIAETGNSAETAIASLPLSQSDIQETVRMINQVSGYTSTLSDKLADGATMTAAEKETIVKIHENIAALKVQLNKFARKIRENNYSILNQSLQIDSNGNAFSSGLAQLHEVDIDYPTMIYDGPFSDSVTNVAVKGISGNKVSKDEASKIVSERFKNVVSVYFDNDTNGRFQTYNFRMKNSDEEMLYVQVTQQGGNILTVSGAGKGNAASIKVDDAEKLAIQFAEDNGIEKPNIVWKDSIENTAYFNIAPKQGSVILYPDLVKVKVDLGTGTIVGYDATTYFTNHTNRTLESAKIKISDARNKLPNGLNLIGERLVLAPLDYNREVLCFEFECTNDDETFYFYVNAVTGAEENILKVIETDDGNKLL